MIWRKPTFPRESSSEFQCSRKALKTENTRSRHEVSYHESTTILEERQGFVGWLHGIKTMDYDQGYIFSMQLCSIQSLADLKMVAVYSWTPHEQNIEASLMDSLLQRIWFSSLSRVELDIIEMQSMMLLRL